jgi:hypothetical protein
MHCSLSLFPLALALAFHTQGWAGWHVGFLYSPENHPEEKLRELECASVVERLPGMWQALGSNSQAWWYISVISAPRKLRQEDA